MWDLPKSGIEPISPAFAGGFLSTGIRGIKMEESLVQASEVGDQASELLLTPWILPRCHGCTQAQPITWPLGKKGSGSRPPGSNEIL